MRKVADYASKRANTFKLYQFNKSTGKSEFVNSGALNERGLIEMYGSKYWKKDVKRASKLIGSKPYRYRSNPSRRSKHRRNPSPWSKKKHTLVTTAEVHPEGWKFFGLKYGVGDKPEKQIWVIHDYHYFNALTTLERKLADKKWYGEVSLSATIKSLIRTRGRKRRG
jgi:hypothetical protein